MVHLHSVSGKVYKVALKYLNIQNSDWWFSYFARKLNKITKFIEENKEKFTKLDLEDVQVREKLKHATSKAKKLEKQLQKDKEKVGYVGEILSISCLM